MPVAGNRTTSSPAHGEGWHWQRRAGPPHDVVEPDQRNVRLDGPDTCQHPPAGIDNDMQRVAAQTEESLALVT